MPGVIFGLLVLGAIVLGVVALVRRALGKREAAPSAGGDLIAYLLLALAVGTAGFALAELGQAAFPGDGLVLDTNQRVATSLAGLVVAAPLAVILWRRQADRRREFPESAGWTVYLALIEAVFMSATVLAAYSILNWLIGDGDAATWTDLLVFGGVVGFHEWAAGRTPPRSDGAELPRVVGSAIALVAMLIGLGGVTYWLLERLYSTLSATAGGPELGSTIALVIVGVPIWWYRWLRPWQGAAGTPRSFWMALTSVAGLATVAGTTVAIVAQTLLFLFTDTDAAGSYFGFLPEALAVGLMALLAWAHHRRRLGPERTDPVRAYEYAMTALGLGTGVGAATALTSIAFAPADFIGTPAEVVIVVVTVLVAGLVVWSWFWSRATRAPREIEAATTPRRFYLVGLAVVTGLTAAGALIAALVIVFQWLLGSGDIDTLAVPASLFVFSAVATWHLLRVNGHDRELIVSEEVITPYSVTIICSHPGMIAARFPKAANLRVIYRADDAGPIDETMADAIVETVGNRSSLVWVDADGFRVAGAR